MKFTILQILLLFAIGFILFFYSFNTSKILEQFSTILGGDYPSEVNDVLIQDIFPITGINSVSDKQASDVWWKYPIFKVGSFAQITNNIRYPRNPDTGRCMPEEFCDALYKNRQNKSNYVKPLPQINPECGTRIGYFTTATNLLPFRTNLQNILY